MQAMLDAAPGGSEDDSQRSSESNRSSEDSEPREAVKQEDSGDLADVTLVCGHSDLREAIQQVAGNSLMLHSEILSPPNFNTI